MAKYKVYWTKQKTQKTKRWADGFLMAKNGKLTLLDEDGSSLDSEFHSKPIDDGEILDFPKYLAEIVELIGDAPEPIKAPAPPPQALAHLGAKRPLGAIGAPPLGRSAGLARPSGAKPAYHPAPTDAHQLRNTTAGGGAWREENGQQQQQQGGGAWSDGPRDNWQQQQQQRYAQDSEEPRQGWGQAAAAQNGDGVPRTAVD
ncbi:hypothetical protein T484DRAFT_1811313 [Baffinella frigidus]|nr:hypothetical protein T484DRAFT_1811313 [Cryptophyta sp. CCMP2293]